jgi:hypothetical protein
VACITDPTARFDGSQPPRSLRVWDGSIARSRLPSDLGEETVVQARQGEIDAALAAFREAEGLSPSVQVPADVLNGLCWFGSLHGRAGDVLFAGERAVALAPKNASFIDTRGLARCLTGDLSGALSDFETVISAAGSAELLASRKQWVVQLRQGRNPINRDVLKSLLAR